eukprot:IDg13160t1
MQKIESRQGPAVETTLNLPREDLENNTPSDAQISETHDIENNSAPSHASTIPREPVRSHGVYWRKLIASAVHWCIDADDELPVRMSAKHIDLAFASATVPIVMVKVRIDGIWWTTSCQLSVNTAQNCDPSDHICIDESMSR